MPSAGLQLFCATFEAVWEGEGPWSAHIRERETAVQQEHLGGHLQVGETIVGLPRNFTDFGLKYSREFKIQ